MSSEFIEHRSGLLIPREAYDLALELEAAGWTLKRVADKLSVTRSTTGSGVDDSTYTDPDTETGQPGQTPKKPDKLSESQMVSIRKWRDHLLVVVDLQTDPRCIPG